MKKIIGLYQKITVTAILIIAYIFFPKVGYGTGSDIFSHLLYPLSHVNIFHLAANILFMWMLPCTLRLWYSYPIAVLCSFLPYFTIYSCDNVTMGFSAVLFAVVGISWGRVNRFRDMIMRNKWFLLIPFFIPHINAFIHLYSLLVGYVVGNLMFRYATRNT